MKKNIFLILIFFLFSACGGYSPVYKNSENVNFDIEITSLTGDRYINNNINNDFRKYSKKQNSKKNLYQLSIDSKYEKKSISKDQSGNNTNYELKVITTVNIILNNSDKKVVIVEKLNMKSMNDTFEEKEYEKTIKSNFANSISKKIISSILNYQ